ncbi:MAG: NAD(P)-dependent oxidoreductase [Firmicutes bacterium]|nr:NAD(P)-dependent oxidoreductase [Bacillota bacterium]
MILITGGMGFIGLSTAEALVSQGESVLLGRHRASRLPAFLAPHYQSAVFDAPLELGDMASVQQLFQAHEIHAVVHLAFSAWGVSTAQQWQETMQGLLHLLEAARQHGVKRIVFASSVDVYSEAPQGPFREEDPLYPATKSAIGAYKQSGEILGRFYTAGTPVEFVAVRIGVVYGPLYHSLKNLPGQMAHAIRAKARQWRPQETELTPSRSRIANDFVYVKDCARGLAGIATAPCLNYPVYNLGGGQAVTDVMLAGVARDLGLDVDPEWMAALADGPEAANERYMRLDRIATDIGYRPRFDIKQGLEDYLAWLDHEPE